MPVDLIYYIYIFFSHRSRSETRLHPALFNNSLNKQASPGRNGGNASNRCKTPTRQSNSLLDLSTAGMGNGNNGQRSTTPCRGDRFIPNRSTTDKEYAQHSLSRWASTVLQRWKQRSNLVLLSLLRFRSRDDLSSCGNNGDVAGLTEQLRRQKLSQVLHSTTDANSAAANAGSSSSAALSSVNSRILSFRSKAPAADEAHANNLKVRFRGKRSRE